MVIGASVEYVARLEARRDQAACMVDRLVSGFVELVAQGRGDEIDREAFSEDVSLWSHQRDVLTAQIAWYRRDTGAAWPKEPRWCD